MENEKQKETIENSSQNKKINLVIDYSKFQNNFKNNFKQEKIKERNSNLEEKNKLKYERKSKDYAQFLNVSDILNENMSQSDINEKESQRNINLMENNKEKGETIKSKINKDLFKNGLTDNFLINENDEPNLLLDNNELLLSYNFTNGRKKLDKIKNLKMNKEFNKTSLNTYKKKRNYVKFINKNNMELKLSHSIGKEKTSYAKINEKNRLFKDKNYRSKFINKDNKFNVLNDANNNYNNSVLTISDISAIPSTTTTMDYITGNTSNNISTNKYYYNSKINKMRTLQNFKSNKLNFDKNKRNFSKENITYHNVDELRLKNDNNKKGKKSFEKKENYTMYINKNKSNTKKSEDLISLLDNIKIKYKNQENKFINQQKNMKSEIEILREKLKTLSINEALYQVEIEKLKRNNNNNDNNNSYNKLDDIKMNHNKNNNKNNLYSFSKRNAHSKFEQLLELFNLDKDFISDENILSENEDFFNYEKAFKEYPQMKKFIELLVKRYKNEKEYRTRLEEKTVEIFTNDMKTIDILEKKIKKYEENNKQFKNNSCLNISLDAGLSDNITKNSCRSCKSCDNKIFVN